MTQLTIRAAKSAKEIQDIWYPVTQQEGWNPGKIDPNIFIQAAPENFFIASLDKDIGCCVALPYDNNTAFIGYYILYPEYRGKGYGFVLFKKCLDSVKGMNVGLSAVEAQVSNYAKMGFKPSSRHRCYKLQATKETTPSTSSLLDVKTIPRSKLVESDFAAIGMKRSKLFNDDAYIWTDPAVFGYAIRTSDKLAAWALCRPQVDGYRIGPLYAQNDSQADTLVDAILAKLPVGTKASLSTELIPWISTLEKRYTVTAAYPMTTMYTGENPYNRLYAMFDEGMG